MSDESREHILAEFQNFTCLEHIDECICILQQYDWNLMNAVQAVHERIGCANDNGLTIVPLQDTTDNDTVSVVTTTTSINNKRQSDSDDINDIDQPRIIKTIPGSQRTTQGTNSIAYIGPVRDLNFTIKRCDDTANITITDSATVYQLKTQISEKIPLPPSKQHFTNWVMKSYDDHTLLRDLHLPKENLIQLTSIENGTVYSIPNYSTTSTTTSEQLPITVLYEDQSGQLISHKCTLEANTTISELKHKIQEFAHIPIEEQNWLDISDAKDSDELRQRLPTSQTSLTVCRSNGLLNQQLPSSRKHANQNERNDDEKMDIDHDDTLDTYENDAQVSSQNNLGIVFGTTTMTSREPLIPDDCTDDTSALQNFSRVFQVRYDSPGPELYMGPLDQAIQHSLYSSIYDRRPLAIYIHDDQSVCANVFCSQVLAAESIIEYLKINYVFWAWDASSNVNRTRLYETIRRYVGNQCVQRVGSMENDSFPLLLIVIRSRGLLELVNIIEGKSTPSEVLLNLIQSQESFEEQRLRDVDEEVMRERRENLKKQQEDEYEQSLQADLAKERARQEQQDANERMKQQRLQQQKESKDRLPEEPSETEKNITQFKIRLPNDEGVLMRRFRINDSLQVLFDYLASQGRILGEYKLLTTYPKRDLTSLNLSDTFEQLKLYPQEQLILESL